MIEYDDVHKAFDAPVLRGVSLSVHDGETLAIVGPSGTGKSVLLKCTIALVVPDSGDVRIDGQSVVFAGHKELQAIRRKVGYVFQNAALFDSMSVFENVALGLSPETLRTIAQKDLLDQVSAALDQVNLEPEPVLGKLPAELSGGMRKRVGLARAIIGSPRILLYDEPVTGLDPLNAAIVEELIKKIRKELAVTSVVVTHDIEGALSTCDRVAFLDEGRLRFVGTPTEFRRSGQPIVRAFADRRVAAEAARARQGVSR